MDATIYLHSDGYVRVEKSPGSGRVILDLSPAEPGVPNVTLFFESLESARGWLAKVTEGIERLGR